MAKKQQVRENDDVGKGVTRMVTAYGNRVAGKSEKSTVPDIEEFAALVKLRALVDSLIDDAAVALHEGPEGQAGHSWAEIGKVLGITRQSARERFMTGDTPSGQEDPGIE